VSGEGSKKALRATVESVAMVVTATLAVASLNAVAPVSGLGVVYLLAVVVTAIRNGLVAALATAVASVLALNYFFITPIHRLTIADSENVVALAVFLIVAAVVGRLAAAARARAAEAEARARLASAREAESEMLAGVAALLLGGGRVEEHLPEIAERASRALGVSGRVELELGAAPSTRPGKREVRVPSRAASCWLHVPRDTAIADSDLERVVVALGGILDVAFERERLRAQAADAEASRRGDVAKTAVLHAISHDLRSPLTAITTAAQGLVGDGVADDDSRELVSVVLDESARLAALVDDLLDLSRVQAGAVNPQLDWCDLHDVIGRAVGNVRRPDADIRIELAEDLPLVRGDAAQLERVFSNLLDNAVRFSPRDRPVRVTGGVGPARVTVRVIDEGPGVPAAQRSRVFEPFVSSRGARGGAGLGLAICRGFVEASGGRIYLQSSDGRETAFAVSLPLVVQPVGAQ
jgi:two-component system, OmpR family, sensor histidine kinase KdpD